MAETLRARGAREAAIQGEAICRLSRTKVPRYLWLEGRDELGRWRPVVREARRPYGFEY